MSGKRGKPAPKRTGRRKLAPVPEAVPDADITFEEVYEPEREVKNVDVVYTQQTFREHARSHSMWSGSMTVEESQSYCVFGETEKYFAREKKVFSDTLLKIFDEIRVNAIDQNTQRPDLVTQIDLEFDAKGFCSIRNNGTSIPIQEKKDRNGKVVFIPEMIFTQEMSGSNLESGVERNVGGQNGIGAKLTNVWSQIFTYSMCWNGIHYSQTCRNGMAEIDKPVITFLDKPCEFTCEYTPGDIKKLKREDKEPHVKISFLPDYAALKYDIAKYRNDLASILEYYSYMTAGFTGCTVYFNKTKINLLWEAFVMMHKTDKDSDFYPSVLNLQIESAEKKNPWVVYIVTKQPSKFEAVTSVNGLYVLQGKHIDHIKETLYDSLAAKIDAEAQRYGIQGKPSFLYDCITLYMKCYINNPEFDSQTKTTLKNSIRQFRNYKIGISAESIWLVIKDAIISQLEKKPKTTTTSKKAIIAEKYEEANLCTTKRRGETTLIFVEGDSAYGTVRRGLTSDKVDKKFNFDYFGIFSTGGVITNMLKKSVEFDSESKKKKRELRDKIIKRHTTAESDSDDDTKSDISVQEPEMLFDLPVPDNKEDLTKYLNDYIETYTSVPRAVIGKKEPRIMLFLRILGLDVRCKYDFTEKGEADFKALRYGAICGLTDQDLDGHNIFALIATMILSRWPYLVMRGYVRRLFTPLIRLYPKSKKNTNVLEFYSLKEFNTWIGEGGNSDLYNIDYCKGLGSHKSKRGEVDSMFTNIDDKIKYFQLDKYTFASMQTYYGKDTSIRKLALATPAREETELPGVIGMTYMYEAHAKAFQRDNIIRKIPHICDGQVRARRKVTWEGLRSARSPIKVIEFASDVVKKTKYHHDPGSLMKTVVYMAKAYPGARNLPLFLPLGEFGTREAGYENSAAPRYIETVLNKRLVDKLFRKEDFCLLKMLEDEGKEIEPEYIDAIIPIVLLESMKIPGTGWKYESHARHIDDVFDNLFKMIKGEIEKCGILRSWKYGFDGKIIEEKGKYYYIGTYSYDSETRELVITSLPPDKFSGTIEYNAKLDTDMVEHAKDYTNEERIKIVMKLTKDAYANIHNLKKTKSPNSNIPAICLYFGMYSGINHCLNLLDFDGRVRTFKSYPEIFDAWYPYRKQMYIKRVIRERILTNLQIEFYENIQRFSKNYEKYKFNTNTAEEIIVKILTEEKYQIYNASIVRDPKRLETEKIVAHATSLENGASYEYLISLGLRDLLDKAYEARQKIISELKDYIILLDKSNTYFEGSDIWIRELEELREVINYGLKTNWMYDEPQYNFQKAKK